MAQAPSAPAQASSGIEWRARMRRLRPRYVPFPHEEGTSFEDARDQLRTTMATPDAPPASVGRDSVEPTE